MNIYKGLKGLVPPSAAGEEGEAIIEPKIDTRVADMKPIEGVEMIARTGTANARLEIESEMSEIKTRLAQKGQHIDMNVLRRAMQIPEELEFYPGKREYPDPIYDLMVNPNPKKKKKGKKGKKKK